MLFVVLVMEKGNKQSLKKIIKQDFDRKRFHIFTANIQVISEFKAKIFVKVY